MRNRLRLWLNKWHAWLFCEQDDVTNYATELIRLSTELRSLPGLSAQASLIRLVSCLGLSYEPSPAGIQIFEWLPRHYLTIALQARFNNLSYTDAAIVINKTYRNFSL